MRRIQQYKSLCCMFRICGEKRWECQKFKAIVRYLGEVLFFEDNGKENFQQIFN